MSNQTQNILTHDGIFHADEVFVSATLILFYFMDSPYTITRTRDKVKITSAQNDSSTWVLDTGGILDFSNRNVDHHQDINLDATNVQIWNWLHKNKIITQEIYNEILPFMTGISDFDVNRHGIIQSWVKFNPDHKYRHLSNIISGYNRDPRNEDLQAIQFNKAIELAVDILSNELYNALERIKSRKIYFNREVIGNNIAVFDEFCSIWKQENDHNFAVLPNPQGYSLNSVNSSEHPLPVLPEDTTDLIFQHKGKFITVFKTKAAAIKVALTLD